MAKVDFFKESGSGVNGTNQAKKNVSTPTSNLVGQISSQLTKNIPSTSSPSGYTNLVGQASSQLTKNIPSTSSPSGYTNLVGQASSQLTKNIPSTSSNNYNTSQAQKATYTPTTGGAYQAPSSYTSTAGQLAAQLSNNSYSGSSTSSNTAAALRQNQDRAIAQAKANATASVNNILNKAKSSNYNTLQSQAKQSVPTKATISASATPVSIATKLGKVLAPYVYNAKQSISNRLNNDSDNESPTRPTIDLNNLSLKNPNWANLSAMLGALNNPDKGLNISYGDQSLNVGNTNKGVNRNFTSANTEAALKQNADRYKTSPTAKDVEPETPEVPTTIDRDYTGGAGLLPNYDLTQVTGAPYYLKEDVMDLLNAINDSIYSGKADVDSIYNDLYASANQYVNDAQATNNQILNSLGDVQATNRSDLLKALAASMASGTYRAANTGSTLANNIQIGDQYAQADQETTRNIMDSNAERLLAALKIRDVDTKNNAYSVAGNIQNGIDDVLANYLYGDVASMNNLVGTLAAINADAGNSSSGGTGGYTPSYNSNSTLEELINAKSDPRYSSDPAYKSLVDTYTKQLLGETSVSGYSLKDVTNDNAKYYNTTVRALLQNGYTADEAAEIAVKFLNQSGAPNSGFNKWILQYPGLGTPAVADYVKNHLAEFSKFLQ